MRLLLKVILTIGLGMISLTAAAREHKSPKARIHKGVKEGSITKAERKKLAQKQKDLHQARKERHQAKAALKDGATAEEKQNLKEAHQKVKEERKELNQEIHQARHNDQNRPRVEKKQNDSDDGSTLDGDSMGGDE